MTVGAVVVGAGASRRAGFDKIFACLAGKPVLAHCVAAFEACPQVDSIALVLSPDNVERGRSLAQQYAWTKVAAVRPGGPRRQDSVAAGLAALADCHWVVIHDAARPLVTTELIVRGLAEAAATGAAIAALPVTDTIKIVGPDRIIRQTPERAGLWAVQTPQVFRYDLIVAAYRGARGEFTDDASLLELCGHPVRVYEGLADNIKITLPGDLALAEFYLQRRACRESA